MNSIQNSQRKRDGAGDGNWPTGKSQNLLTAQQRGNKNNNTKTDSSNTLQD